MWMKNNKPHRDSGPAIFEYHPNGNIAKTECYKDGRLHNESGPAVVEYDANRKLIYAAFYVNGQMKKEEKSPGVSGVKAVNTLLKKP